MKRRDFVKYLSLSVPLFTCGCSHNWQNYFFKENKPENETTQLEDIGAPKAPSEKQIITDATDTKTKSLHFDQDFSDDIFCKESDRQLLEQLVEKFRAVQRYVGNGNFNLLGMDDFFLYSRYAPRIEAVTRREKLFLEELFSFDAKTYGFYGEKNFQSMTENIRKNTTVKVPHTGHFLRKGQSLETYNKIRKDIGSTIILTSGVRALAKQFHLFLEKAVISEGNLSKASRSLAPPGYSFHGQNDFDIGKVGFGLNNFNDEFANTREFKILSDLGYVDIRYKEKNLLGVRFEPWHIKI